MISNLFIYLFKQCLFISKLNLFYIRNISQLRFYVHAKLQVSIHFIAGLCYYWKFPLNTIVISNMKCI